VCLSLFGRSGLAMSPFWVFVGQKKRMHGRRLQPR
jgi:hypothetical protein